MEARPSPTGVDRARASRVARRLDPTDQAGLRRSLVVVALGLVVVPFAALLVSVEAETGLVRWDEGVAADLNRWVHRSDGWVTAFEAISWLGRPPVLAVLVVAVAGSLWAVGRHRAATFLVVTCAAGSVAQVVLKAAVGRTRPAVEVPVSSAFGSSFPSGHAMASTIVYGAIVVVLVPLLPRRARWPVVIGAAVLVLAIGVSRLVLGVHYLTDVTGGFVVGLAWLAGATAAFEVWRRIDAA